GLKTNTSLYCGGGWVGVGSLWWGVWGDWGWVFRLLGFFPFVFCGGFLSIVFVKRSVHCWGIVFFSATALVWQLSFWGAVLYALPG
ncbi:hypothetical protein ACQWKR_23745, partial [Salmonella enterica subsp. enterica serovar Infantis]